MKIEQMTTDKLTVYHIRDTFGTPSGIPSS